MVNAGDSSEIYSDLKINSADELVTNAETQNKFEILIPRDYRDWENDNPVNTLSKDWVDLYKKDGQYFLAKPNYSIERGFAECTGDSTKILNSNRNTLLFINAPNLKLGEIRSVKFGKNKIWPTEKFSFTFNKVKYELRAEGKVLSSENVSTDEGSEIYQNVEDYKLFISSERGSEQLFLKQASFNDTFVNLLFIGDIDRDGKPDFIFGANRDYEEERVILYLSSEADDGKLIKEVSEIAVQFDC